jgi:hypothetical protein
MNQLTGIMDAGSSQQSQNKHHLTQKKQKGKLNVWHEGIS